MNILNEAIAKITAQQPKERTAVWMVGEQLKDMLRAEPHLAELVAQDLEVEAMSIAKCEKKLDEYAKKHKVGGCGCVPGQESDRIIREFYGLPKRDEGPVPVEAPPPPSPGGGIIDLSAFF